MCSRTQKLIELFEKASGCFPPSQRDNVDSRSGSESNSSQCVQWNERKKGNSGREGEEIPRKRARGEGNRTAKELVREGIWGLRKARKGMQDTQVPPSSSESEKREDTVEVVEGQELGEGSTPIKSPTVQDCAEKQHTEGTEDEWTVYRSLTTSHYSTSKPTPTTKKTLKQRCSSNMRKLRKAFQAYTRQHLIRYPEKK